jgi:hypothetical protein
LRESDSKITLNAPRLLLPSIAAMHAVASPHSASSLSHKQYKPRSALPTFSPPPPARARTLPIPSCALLWEGFTPSYLSATSAMTPSPARRSKAPTSSSQGTNRASRSRLLTPLPTSTRPAAGGGNRRGHGPDVRARGRRSGPGPPMSIRSCPPAAPSTSSSSAHAAEGVGVLLPWASSTSTPVAEGLGFCRPTGYPTTRSAMASACGYSYTAYSVGGELC